MSGRDEAARVEERLREELRQARMRADVLEHDLRAVRASTSFRFGHAIAIALGAGWRVRPLRAAVRSLLAGRPAAPRGPEPPRADVVLFVAWGAGPEQLERLVARVRRLQTVLVRLEPVFVVDGDVVGPIAARGYAFEHVIALGDWVPHRPAEEWGAYVTDRMAAIVAEHAPGAVVVLEGDEGRSALEQGVLDALVVPSLQVGADNLLSALDPDAETPVALGRALVAETFTPARRDTRP